MWADDSRLIAVGAEDRPWIVQYECISVTGRPPPSMIISSYRTLVDSLMVERTSSLLVLSRLL